MNTSMRDNKLNVLIVDDDLAILDLMKNILKGFNFNPSVARSGEEALETARNDAPDVILLDLHMPGMGGREVIDALKAEPALREVPVIILSGEMLARRELDALGAVCSVTKPFDLPILIERIRSVSVRNNPSDS